MFCILNMLFYHPVSEATPNSKITGAYCGANTNKFRYYSFTFFVPKIPIFFTFDLPGDHYGA